MKTSPPVAQQTAGLSAGTAAHIGVLDGMRGVAALAVCIYHTESLRLCLPWFYAHIAARGKLGVDVFFVISGFVVPYSMFSHRYRVPDWPRFLARRLVRIDPPYFATVALVVAYSWAAAHTRWHRGPPPDLGWRRLLAHLAYANAFFGLPWLLDSFWTLAVEFQFYVLVGLIYPLLAWRRWMALPALAALGALALALPAPAHLPHYLPVFLLGIFAFRYRMLGGNGMELALGVTAAAALAVYAQGVEVALAALASCAAILFLRYTSGLLRWLGGISYPLYLAHCLVLAITSFQGTRLLGVGPGAQAVLAAAGIAGSLAAAVGLHRTVELPAQRWAAHIRYGRPRPASGAGAVST